jgi:O-antigen/teichoic acid export membrane protein
VLTARYFGTEIFGVFSLAVIITGIAATLAGLGISEGIIRFVPFYKARKNERAVDYLIRKGLVLTFVTGILCALALYFGGDFIGTTFFHSSELGTYLRATALVPLFLATAGIFLSLLRSYERITRYSLIVNPLQNGAKVALLALFIYVGITTNALVVSYVGSTILVLLIAAYSCKSYLAKAYTSVQVKGKEKERLFKELISFSWPFIFIGVIYSIFYWADSLIIGYFMNATDVGIYNAAVTLVSLFAIVPDLFIRLFQPLIVSRFAEGRNRTVQELSERVIKWILICNLPLMLALLFFPGIILKLFFGQEFMLAASSLMFLTVGGIISGISSFIISLVSLKKSSRDILSYFIISSVLNIILDILLVPHYGLPGAAFATSVSWVALIVFLMKDMYFSHGFIPAQRFLLRLLSLSVLFFIALAVVKSFVTLSTVGVVFFLLSAGSIYLILLVILKVVDTEDIALVKESLTKIKRLTGAIVPAQD